MHFEPEIMSAFDETGCKGTIPGEVFWCKPKVRCGYGYLLAGLFESAFRDLTRRHFGDCLCDDGFWCVGKIETFQPF